MPANPAWQAHVSRASRAAPDVPGAVFYCRRMLAHARLVVRVPAPLMKKSCISYVRHGPERWKTNRRLQYVWVVAMTPRRVATRESFFFGEQPQAGRDPSVTGMVLSPAFRLRVWPGAQTPRGTLPRPLRDSFWPGQSAHSSLLCL